MRYFPLILVLQKMFDTWTVCRCHNLSVWLQVQKLQSIIASRATQYSHDAKRKEREAAKLKERLSQLLVDRKDKKLGNSTLWQYTLMNSSKTINEWSSHLLLFKIAIDVLNCLGRADGKRSHWKTAKATARYPESLLNHVCCKCHHQVDNQREFCKLFCAATKAKCTSPC